VDHLTYGHDAAGSLTAPTDNGFVPTFAPTDSFNPSVRVTPGAGRTSIRKTLRMVLHEPELHNETTPTHDFSRVSTPPSR
jgi:hypothetical protein